MMHAASRIYGIRMLLWITLFMLLQSLSAWKLHPHAAMPRLGKKIGHVRGPALRAFGDDQTGAMPNAPIDTIQPWEMGPPPDLPSLLLSNRIVYVGMPLVPSVTETIIAQLLYLNHHGEGIITMYINSPGTNSPDGKAFSFDTEAFAIADTMLFIRPPIRTVCVGQAYGTAAMLLALGQKGNRLALPNASIMLSQPKGRARGQATDVAIKAKEVAANRRTTAELIAQACGKDVAIVEQDSSRAKYLSAEEAIKYGLVDKVLYPGHQQVETPPFLDML